MKGKDKKGILREEIDEEIKNREIDTNYLKKYRQIMDTPLEKLISKHIVTGKKSISVGDEKVMEVNTELLIRLLLK